MDFISPGMNDEALIFIYRWDVGRRDNLFIFEEKKTNY